MDTPTDLTRLFMRVARRVRSARSQALRPYGLSPHQAGAFLAISRHLHHHPDSEMRIADLARALRIAPRSATEVVDALCERGLIERSPSATDRRATSLLLTTDGQGLLADVSEANPAHEVFTPLSDTQRAELAAILTTILSETAPDELDA